MLYDCCHGNRVTDKNSKSVVKHYCELLFSTIRFILPYVVLRPFPIPQIGIMAAIKAHLIRVT